MSDYSNLKCLFDTPVVEAHSVDTGYDNANRIYDVRTREGRYVVKIMKAESQPGALFWDGLHTLFGLNGFHNLEYRKPLVQLLRQCSPIAVPRVVDVSTGDDQLDRPYMITEYLPGEPADLKESSDRRGLAEDLGDYLGSVHQISFDYWGCYPEAPRFEPDEWPTRLGRALRYMGEKWWAHDDGVQRELEERIQQALSLQVPGRFSLVFPDLRLSQFLMRDGRLAALVDVESQVLGPPELDFIALEYVLRRQDVEPFTRAYEKHLSLPDLRAVRGLYRFLYFVIAAVRRGDFSRWMRAPKRFA